MLVPVATLLFSPLFELMRRFLTLNSPLENMREGKKQERQEEKRLIAHLLLRCSSTLLPLLLWFDLFLFLYLERDMGPEVRRRSSTDQLCCHGSKLANAVGVSLMWYRC